MSDITTHVLGYDDMLAFIEDRSAALRAAAAAVDLDAPVPGCPDWSVRDLVSHLGEVQLFWSAAVAAGPSDTPPPDEDRIEDRHPESDLLSWSAEATAVLAESLRQAWPDRGCWTWWGASGAPMTAGAVARHQVQEAAVHAFDAQQAAGRAEPLPARVAADGVGEYLTVELPSNGSWPNDPAKVLLHAGDGGSWLVDLGTAGAKASPMGGGVDGTEADVAVTASPSDLVLAFYRRDTSAELQATGDHKLFGRLLGWPNLD